KRIRRMLAIGLTGAFLSTAVLAQSANTTLFPAGMATDCPVYDPAACVQVVYTPSFAFADFEAALPKYMDAKPPRKMIELVLDPGLDKAMRTKLQADMLNYAKKVQEKLRATKTKLVVQLMGAVPDSIQDSFIEAAT